MPNAYQSRLICLALYCTSLTSATNSPNTSLYKVPKLSSPFCFVTSSKTSLRIIKPRNHTQVLLFCVSQQHRLLKPSDVSHSSMLLSPLNLHRLVLPPLGDKVIKYIALDKGSYCIAMEVCNNYSSHSHVSLKSNLSPLQTLLYGFL